MCPGPGTARAHVSLGASVPIVLTGPPSHPAPSLHETVRLRFTTCSYFVGEEEEKVEIEVRLVYHGPHGLDFHGVNGFLRHKHGIDVLELDPLRNMALALVACGFLDFSRQKPQLQVPQGVTSRISQHRDTVPASFFHLIPAGIASSI